MTLNIIIGLLLVISVGLMFFFSSNTVLNNLFSITTFGSLVAALFQVFRDQLAFQ